MALAGFLMDGADSTGVIRASGGTSQPIRAGGAPVAVSRILGLDFVVVVIRD